MVVEGVGLFLGLVVVGGVGFVSGTGCCLCGGYFLD